MTIAPTGNVNVALVPDIAAVTAGHLVIGVVITTDADAAAGKVFAMTAAATSMVTVAMPATGDVLRVAVVTMALLSLFATGGDAPRTAGVVVTIMAAGSMAGAVNGIARMAGANKVTAVKIVVGITADGCLMPSPPT